MERDTLLMLGPVIFIVGQVIPDEPKYRVPRILALVAGGSASAYGAWLTYKKKARAAWGS